MMTAATCVFRSRVPLTEFSVFRTIRDVTTSAVLSSLRDFATRPKSIVKGETHVNKTAVSLYQRMKENAHGIRDVYAEQLQQVRMEAIREEEEKMKVLDASLPEHDQLARMFQAAYTTMQEREPDYTLKKIRLEFLDVLSQLHPEDPGCSKWHNRSHAMALGWHGRSELTHHRLSSCSFSRRRRDFEALHEGAVRHQTPPKVEARHPRALQGHQQPQRFVQGERRARNCRLKTY